MIKAIIAVIFLIGCGDNYLTPIFIPDASVDSYTADAAIDSAPVEFPVYHWAYCRDIPVISKTDNTATVDIDIFCAAQKDIDSNFGFKVEVNVYARKFDITLLESIKLRIGCADITNPMMVSESEPIGWIDVPFGYETDTSDSYSGICAQDIPGDPPQLPPGFPEH